MNKLIAKAMQDGFEKPVIQALKVFVAEGGLKSASEDEMTETFEKAIRISQTISLKRQADALESISTFLNYALESKLKAKQLEGPQHG